MGGKTYRLYNNVDTSIIFGDFSEAVKKIQNIIYNHTFSESQCYHDGIPFSVGSFIYSLVSDRLASDYDIIVFERIRMLLEDLYRTSIYNVDYIKDNYTVHYSDDVEYEFTINKKDDEIILKLESGYDFLYTNMFNMQPNKKYYYISHQEVATKSKNDKRELGEEVDFSIYLETIELCKPF